ncbi:MAG: asparagine synthase C-terminal domain-containing protein, partial [Bacteroidota bacterium]
NLPQSRHSRWANLGRQLHRFSEGMKRPHQERYWRWATLQNEEEANYLMREKLIIREQRLSDDAYAYKKRKDRWLRHIRKEGNFRDVLYTDMELVLPNDMLTKVDMMSMANSLEVRTPFLDHRLVNFAFSLPVRFKINTNMTKKILQDAFRSRLPAELYQRPKQGFEVPLLPWFQSELRSRIESDWLQDDFIDEQQVFNPDAIRHLKQKLFSSNPGDTPATVWALIVFQHWWKRYLG